MEQKNFHDQSWEYGNQCELQIVLQVEMSDFVILGKLSFITQKYQEKNGDWYLEDSSSMCSVDSNITKY